MSGNPAVSKSPQDHVRELEKLAAAGDLPAMLNCIGDLHSRWDSLDVLLQSEVTTLEAVFLTMLNARTRGST
jgi:hypothetical protein